MTTCWIELDAPDEGPLPDGWSPYPSVEEKAFAEELLRLYPGERPDALDQSHPEDYDGEGSTDGELLGRLARPAHSMDLVLLDSIDPWSLDEPRDRLAYLRALDRVEALLGSLRVRALTGLAGAEATGDSLADIHVEHEVSVARRVSPYSAGKAIELARTITTAFPAFLDALRDGVVSWGHLAVLVDRTRFVVDETAIAEVARRGLPKAKRTTPGQFAGEVEKLVARFDPDAAERHRRTRSRDRAVRVRRLADGMGYLGYVDEWTIVSAVAETIDADARRLQVARRTGENASTRSRRKAARKVDSVTAHEGHPVHLGDPAAIAIRDTADQCRADAFAARMLGTVGEDGTVTWDRTGSTTVVAQVVIDLDTLAGLRDGLVLLDGSPVPAEIGRDWAAAAVSWRRMVTDPVTGHLLDYGRATYSAEPLRRYVLARDACRAPGHTCRGARRLQMDHAEEFPEGPTSAANCGGLCTTSHQLKTARLVDITESRADGSCTWTTRWGQVVRVPPRAFLEERAPAPPPAPPPDDHDPPPF